MPIREIPSPYTTEVAESEIAQMLTDGLTTADITAAAVKAMADNAAHYDTNTLNIPLGNLLGSPFMLPNSDWAAIRDFCLDGGGADDLKEKYLRAHFALTNDNVFGFFALCFGLFRTLRTQYRGYEPPEMGPG